MLLWNAEPQFDRRATLLWNVEPQFDHGGHRGHGGLLYTLGAAPKRPGFLGTTSGSLGIPRLLPFIQGWTPAT